MSMALDEIYALFTWDQSYTDREYETRTAVGIEEAKRSGHIRPFILPINPAAGKSIWGPCAEVIASKTDEELKPHLQLLFEWLCDMNWPGAWVIFERLSDMPFSALEEEYYAAVKRAQGNNDALWLEALEDFRGRAEENV